MQGPIVIAQLPESKNSGKGQVGAVTCVAFPGSMSFSIFCLEDCIDSN
jgi:hypothetical protein